MEERRWEKIQSNRSKIRRRPLNKARLLKRTSVHEYSPIVGSRPRFRKLRHD
jgi:hypothetical protein